MLTKCHNDSKQHDRKIPVVLIQLSLTFQVDQVHDNHQVMQCVLEVLDSVVIVVGCEPE